MLSSLTSIEVVTITLLCVLVYLAGYAMAMAWVCREDTDTDPIWKMAVIALSSLVIWPFLIYPMWREKRGEQVAEKLTEGAQAPKPNSVTRPSP